MHWHVELIGALNHPHLGDGCIRGMYALVPLANTGVSRGWHAHENVCDGSPRRTINKHDALINPRRTINKHDGPVNPVGETNLQQS